MSRRTRAPEFDMSNVVFGDAVPLDEVYAEVILHACPTCKAEVGDFCLNGMTHKISKLPCVRRMTL